MNHESRIKQLERELKQVKEALRSLTLVNNFVPVAKAAIQLGINSWVIKQRVKTDPQVKLDKHYRMNGNRYLINVEEWRNLIASDVKAKRQ